ncbi:tail fiber protein [Flavobacterium gyeonganense]|uniref:tail fiber protein n=1 Tax=Flavobacterium gyeonganense TaxID=1310418 RepID=UPI00241420D8|nr:tail fiber protein [Flavobacterium gyeonganense]
MLTRLTILLFFILTSSINAQIYTPSGTIQGSSWNNDIGIGTNNPTAKLHINNGDNSYGAILANANEFPFSLYTKTFNTVPYLESFRIGLKYLENENNGFISFYRGGSVSGGFLGFSTDGIERIRISDIGNVGIGTSSPIGKLQIDYDPVSQVGILLNNNTGSTVGSGNIQFADNGTLKWNLTTNASNDFFLYNQDGPGQGANLFIKKSNGNVGIGTTNPTKKLEIYSNANTTLKIANGNPAAFPTEIHLGGNPDFTKSAIISAPNAAGWYRQDLFFCLANGNDTSSVGLSDAAMVIKSYNAGKFGNVGIGTIAPDEKLTVKGKIHAEEVKIDLSVPAPDYVFRDDYKLKTLQEVEDYIKKNSHLPEIPSAKEIEKNGLMLAEMNMSLLKKLRN